MRLFLVVALLVSLVGPGFAQAPCTPLRVDKVPWPSGHNHFSREERLEHLSYSGGLYFMTIVGIDETSSPFEAFSAVSRDMRTFHAVNIPRLRADQKFLFGIRVRPVYVHGWYYTNYDEHGLMRSRDGETWEVLPVIISWPLEPINWTGEQFVVQGRFGDVWTSPDGKNWVYRTQVPETYRPIFTGLADRWRLVVTGAALDGKRRRGYTEDYEHWHLEYFDPEPEEDGVGGFIGNGWFFPYIMKTRDGKTWVPMRSALSGYGSPDNTFFAGREMLGMLSEYTPAPNIEVRIHLLTSPDGISWTDRVLATLQNTPERVLIAKNYLAGWDGKRVWTVLFWQDRTSGNPSHIEDYFIASTSCADLGHPVMVPGVANTPGALGSQWRTALSLHYPGPGVSEVLVQWLPYDTDNSEPQEVRLFFATGESMEFPNVLAELFQTTGVGSLRIVSVGPEVVVEARTYNAVQGGEFGQGLSQWHWEDGISEEEEGWLVGLAESGDASGYRTNLAVQNLWVDPVDVEVVFVDATGKVLGRLRKHLRAFEGYHWYRPLRALGLGPVEKVTAVVRLLSQTGRVAAYASRVSNVTGDGWTIPARKLPRQFTVP